jgi:hypothetical protein
MSTAVDLSQWPVVVVVIDETLDADGATAATVELQEVVDRGERVGFVFDYHRGIPAAQQIISMWMAQQIEALGRLVTGAVTVVPAERVEHMQAVITGGGFPMPFPSWATATVDEGVTWVQSQP